MSSKNHWENVYSSKGERDVSWYQPHLARSLELIRATGVSHDAHVIDVGGGASTLVDDLLDEGFAAVTVVDLAESALELARERLGARSAKVQWIAGDITRATLPTAAYDVWHDRAVFHFLTQAADRAAYVAQVARSVKAGGYVIVATFGKDGPEKCSGLPVARYDAEHLHDEFGTRFELLRHIEERHVTPWGSVQEFVYCMCSKHVTTS